MIAGWELLGLSSMLLIGFFHDRTFPVRNALRAFTVYRVCDIGLLTGTVLMHHYAHTSDFLQAFGADSWPSGSDSHFGPGASLIALCMLWAACGKSALFPMGSWLPRAMEGPTPSSAIFYGALSVHAGAYLLLRMSPLLAHAPVARAAIVLVGAATALHGQLVERVQSDVKSQLAYATITQVGVIFVEIGLGLPRLALFHLVAHALLRTLQLLRAPNAIHDAQMMQAAAGTHHFETGRQYRAIAPFASRTLALSPVARALSPRCVLGALGRGLRARAQRATWRISKSGWCRCCRATTRPIRRLHRASRRRAHPWLPSPGAATP